MNRRTRKTAGLKEVIKRITENVWDASYQNYLVDKVTKFFQTKEKQYDLTNDEARQIYRKIDYHKDLKLNNGNEVDLDWSKHAEFRSDLRDISPIKVNQAVENELNQKLRRHDEIGDERLKKPGIGTVVLDYNIRENPGMAKVITVFSSSIERYVKSKKRRP